MNRFIGSKRALHLALLSGAVGAMLMTGSCSVAINTTAIQCLSEAECLSKGAGFENTTCDPKTKTCVSVAASGGCLTNQACIDQANGDLAICRKTDHKCVALKTPECPRVLGQKTQVGDDNVVVLGTLTPANDSLLGAQMEAAVALAQDDITKGAVGLPPTSAGAKPRPVVFVSCNEFGAGIDGLIRAGNHLVKDLGVPVIVGPIDSQNAIQIAAQVTLPNRVLDILPVSNLSGLTLLPNPSAPTPLIWRLAPAATAFVTADVLQRVISLGIAQSTDPIKVMVIAEGNIIGLALGQRVQGKLVFNGKSAGLNAQDMPSNYTFGSIGDQRDTVNNPVPNATAAKVIGAALAFQPHIIIHTSNITAVTSVYIPLESQWPMNVPKPIHLSVLNSWASPPLYGFIGANVSRQQRMFFARPKSVPPSAVVGSWNSRFNSANTQFNGAPINPFVWAVYDAATIAALTVAGVGSAPLTGTNAAGVLFSGRLNPPNTKTQFGDTGLEFGAAFTTLSEGGGINYEGVGAPYDFDLASGAPLYDAEISCIKVDMNSKRAIDQQSSGFIWDHTTDTGQGSVMGCP